MLFSDRSIWTMVHGIALGGGSLLMLSAALFFLIAARAFTEQRQSRAFAGLLASTAVILWLAVLVGTYVTFPPYRAAPPEGTTDLAAYPRTMILADPDTAWLHSFAMETKEHVPWIAAMLTTAAAFIAVRYGSATLKDGILRTSTTALVAFAFSLVAYVSLLGIFVNKVAPLE